jgi:ATP-dependent DNA helicase RecQ
VQLSPIQLLEKYWGHTTFRGSQEAIIEKAMEGRDALVLMPTGGGKSVCYQIPALAQNGLCIVVSPLVALIKDQVNELKRKGIKAMALTGGIPFEELLDLLDNAQFGGFKFLYLSPERLQQEVVQERIREMDVNLIAIDEAHCISEWGHDFRPAYLDCAQLRQLAPNAPVMALTATATQKTQDDIVANLELINPYISKDSFKRNNIHFGVYELEDKPQRLVDLCKMAQGSSIVYVRSRKRSEELAQLLNNKGIEALFFHGGLSAGEKEKRLQAWVQGQASVMVATNAFGMGIDKADVRLVLHYQPPESIEAYYQEAGRAGRDGLPAQAILLLGPDDTQHTLERFKHQLPSIAFIKQVYRNLNNYFQIGYGELPLEVQRFRFLAFCHQYQTGAGITYNALRILDQYGVLRLDEQFSTHSLVRFICPKTELAPYLDTHRAQSGLIQTVLRTYGGIWEYETKVDTYRLSKKLGYSEEKVAAQLTQLAQDGLIEYTAKHRDAEITFLCPREDERTINPFAKIIKTQQQLKMGKLRAMLKYINLKKACRQQYILQYFGETQPQKCGHCDHCLQEARVPTDTLAITDQIIAVLSKRKCSSRELINGLPHDPMEILEALKELLAEGKITIGPDNTYECPN